MYCNYRVPGIRTGLIYLTGPAWDTHNYFAFYCGPPNLDKLPAEHSQLLEVMLQNTEYNSAPGAITKFSSTRNFHVLRCPNNKEKLRKASGFVGFFWVKLKPVTLAMKRRTTL
ncbi:hypothetical protein AVEN_214569-1 [Araneus ventricosus]|uniref:Uncharacterized protein n=1 Tax=Araneus ventricosus TaxID=182803 RepID=A0A4Y2L5T5_ARAVE|nr:hypothetical protein AVEN_214569-1 [Araneus ventricosus]